jgi:hypothetical protein
MPALRRDTSIESQKFVIAARRAAGNFRKKRKWPPPRVNLPSLRKIAICGGMESKFGCTEKHVVVLQDHKRLPARFFARVFGALISRLG